MQIDIPISAATQIRASFGVRIDGIDRTSAFGKGWSVTHDADAAYASASLPVLVPFSLTLGRHTVAMYAGWDGPTQPVFVGEVVATADTYYPRHSTLTAGGYLRRCDVGLNVKEAFYYDGGSSSETAAVIAKIPAGYDHVPISDDADLIVHILETYGITPSTTGHHIEASSFIPARLSPILWDIGKSGWSIIQDLDKIADYATSDGRLGQVLRKQVYGTVPSGVRHHFQQGTDILDLGRSTAYEVYNQSKVTGGTDPASPDPDNPVTIVGIQPVGTPDPSPFIPDPPGVRTDEELSSDFIETVVDAETIAATRLARLSQPLQEITLTTFACSDLDIGDGLRVTAPVFDLDTNAFVVTHRISGDPYRSELTLRGSVTAGIREDAPPTPQMVISVTLEHVVVAGTLTPLAMITVDARASSDPDGTIASWEIEVDATSSTGTAIADALITHPSTSPSPVPVTLTVTDSETLSATLTQYATWDEGSALIEPLVTAEATVGAASNNGEATWHTFTAPVTAVAPIALGGAVLYGCTDGKLYRSLDMLATAPSLVHTFPAGVSCLWENETAPARWLAGLTNGDLWLSIDDGLTWTKVHTFAHAVNDVAESPAAVGQITACSGDSLWHSFDSGATFAALITGVDAVALRFAAGPFDGTDQAWVGFDSGFFASTAGGPGFNLPVAAAITGLTMSLDARELYILTDSTATYSYTTAGGLVAGPPTGTATNRAIRSGSGKWVYAATDGALQKLIPHGSVYDVRITTSPARSLAVGYGAAKLPSITAGPVEVYIPTYGASGAGIWHYVPGSGWSKIGASTLPAGIFWRWIAASPLNPNHLILLGGYVDYDVYNVSGGHLVMDLPAGGFASPLWVSTDAGVTWAQAPVQVPVGATAMGRIFAVEFSATTPGRWYMTGWGGPAGNRSTRMQGTLTTAEAPWADPDRGNDTEWQTAGEGEDTLSSFHEGAGGAGVLYFNGAGMVGVPALHDPLIIPTPPEPNKPNLDRLPGTRAIVALEGFRGGDQGRVWVSFDYRSIPLKQLETMTFPFVSMDVAGFITAVHDGAFVAQQSSIWHLFNFTPHPYTVSCVAVVVPGSEGKHYGSIRSDRQTKTAVVARGGDVATDSFVYDGATWTLLPGPSGGDPLSRYGEVVCRP